MKEYPASKQRSRERKGFNIVPDVSFAVSRQVICWKKSDAIID